MEIFPIPNDGPQSRFDRNLFVAQDDLVLAEVIRLIEAEPIPELF